MKAKCKDCGYEWTARVKTPVMCPHCHSTRWNGEAVPDLALPTLTCTRCHSSWTPRKEGRPLTCPKCRSAQWDKPRKRKISPERRAKIRAGAPRASKSQYPYRRKEG